MSEDRKQINCFYVHGSDKSPSGLIGYARFGIALADELARQGVEVFDDMPIPTGLESDAKAARDPKKNDRVPGIAETACWLSVPTHARGWWKDQYTIIYTMWEAMELPEQFRENLHNFDAVVVPCEQNRELFSQYHDNVHKINLGIDPTRWKFTARRPPSQFFDFLVCGSGERKGTQLAYDAFQKVFGGSQRTPIPRLVMKNPRAEDFPGVQMVSGHITDEQEVALYESAHCLLAPSKGEGFGFQPLQAMAQGCPTILTNAHGHAEFADLGIPIGWHEEKAGYFIYGEPGGWWAPNFDELCDAMLDVYENYEQHLYHAAWNSTHVREKFTWERCAHQFLELFGDKLGPYTGRDEWFVPELKRYLIRVNQTWPADIGGNRYLFEPDKDYYELADVKRVLFEAGKLHPSCVVPGDGQDNGLTLAQMKNAQKYGVEHAYCPTCSQRLNSGPTKADDIMAGLL